MQYVVSRVCRCFVSISVAGSFLRPFVRMLYPMPAGDYVAPQAYGVRRMPSQMLGKHEPNTHVTQRLKHILQDGCTARA